MWAAQLPAPLVKSQGTPNLNGLATASGWSQ